MVAAWRKTSFLPGAHPGPIFGFAQTLANPRMRAPASATNLLAAICSPWASSIGRRQDHAGHLALDPGVVRPICETSKLATGQIGALSILTRCFLYYFYPERASVSMRAVPACVPYITENQAKTVQNRPDETISRNPRNHPETDGAYICRHQMAHRRLGGIR